MNFDLQLAGRRALVTGGTRGVGAAVVQGLHEAGVQVIATARSVPAHATEGVRYVAADLSTAEGAAEVARSVLKQWGGIDVLVNVLGGSSAPGGGFAALDDAQWSRRGHYSWPAQQLRTIEWIGRHTQHEALHHLRDIGLLLQA